MQIKQKFNFEIDSYLFCIADDEFKCDFSANDLGHRTSFHAVNIQIYSNQSVK